MSLPSPSRPAHVSCAGCVTRLAPSPCTRLSRARSTMRQSDSPSTLQLTFLCGRRSLPAQVRLRLRLTSVSGFPLTWLTIRRSYRSPGVDGASQVLKRFSCCMPGARTPAGPPASHPIDAFVWASVSLTTSPPALVLLTRLKSLQGGADTPLAYSILCLRFTAVVFACARSFLPTTTAPPAAQNLIGVGIKPLSLGNFHSDRSVKLRLTHQREAQKQCEVVTIVDFHALSA
jgi:hypothetical protein